MSPSFSLWRILSKHSSSSSSELAPAARRKPTWLSSPNARARHRSLVRVASGSVAHALSGNMPMAIPPCTVASRYTIVLRVSHATCRIASKPAAAKSDVLVCSVGWRSVCKASRCSASTLRIRARSASVSSRTARQAARARSTLATRSPDRDSRRWLLSPNCASHQSWVPGVSARRHTALA
jgi:hypothetical protein